MDLYTPSSKTEILADGKVAAVLKGKTVYVDGEALYDENGSVVGTGYAGKEGVSLFRKLYTNVYRTVLETDKDAGVELDFMYRMAMMEGLKV